MLEGDKNGATISRCTRERGDRYARGTETRSGLEVSAANLGCPGARCDNVASISTSCGTSNLVGVNHVGRMKTEAGNWPIRMSCEKARTFLSSGVGLSNYRVKD